MAGPDALKALAQAHEGYFREIERIVGLPKYQTRGDFALVLLPFLKDTVIPTKPDGQPDDSYFAPDCFHFSGTLSTPCSTGMLLLKALFAHSLSSAHVMTQTEKSHQAAGVALWNNLISPAQAKQHTYAHSLCSTRPPLDPLISDRPPCRAGGRRASPSSARPRALSSPPAPELPHPTLAEMGS